MANQTLRHTPEELAARAEAVRQATASIALEGLVVDPEVAEFDRLYALGEISLEEKLVLIKKLYGHE